MPYSINRAPVIDKYDSRLKTGTVPGTDIRLTTAAWCLPLFLAIAAEWHRTVAPLRKGECGGWNFRLANAGAGAWSDHSSGTAIDLNWGHEGAQGPYGGMKTMTAKQIAAAAAIKKKFEVVIWGGDKARGGDYVQPKNWDPMHYALKPGTTAADVTAVMKKLGIRSDGTIAPPKPTLAPFPGSFSAPANLKAVSSLRYSLGLPNPGHTAWNKGDDLSAAIKRWFVTHPWLVARGSKPSVVDKNVYASITSKFPK